MCANYFISIELNKAALLLVKFEIPNIRPITVPRFSEIDWILLKVGEHLNLFGLGFLPT